MTDLLDQRLAEAGRRWQAEQQPPPAVPLERLGQSTRGRGRRRALAAAAAAVVLLGGLAAVLLRLTGGGLTGAPSTSTSPSPEVQQAIQVVPWRDLPAGHPHYPRVHGHVVTPYDGLVATGEIPRQAHPGDTLTFDVVLESFTRVRLDPCPDFTIAFGRHSFHTWRLNCTQVPYQDAHGRPVLPAHTSVHFAMKLEVPDVRGDQKVLWALEGPQETPGFYQVVKVSP